MSGCTPSSSNKSSSSSGDLKWWQLSLIGVGCTIGTGYFLGSSIGIMITGPSIVISFFLASIGTYIVFNVLAKMTAKDPQEGSFCYYAGKAFGKWAGFSCGWNYWASNILIMGSQLIALSILSQFWFPNIALWIFAVGYAILSILVVITGTKGFDKTENILAILKFAAIIMFIILAVLALMGFIKGPQKPEVFAGAFDLFKDGWKGFWASLTYAFYAYGGIEVIGLMAIQLKKKEDAPKAGKVMLFCLTAVYVISLALAVLLVSSDSFHEKESPFVTALTGYNLMFFPHVFNAAIITAGFSTMTASLFGVTNLLVTLSKDGDAPAFFSKKSKRFKQLPIPSLALASIGLIASIITALILPGKIYEYITTAAGILLLYNWFFIIMSSLKLLKTKWITKLSSYLGIVLIFAAVSGTLMDKAVRPGFYISLLFVLIIFLICLKMKKYWKLEKTKIRYY
ncbi:amino acid permease [Bacillus sp. V2I10]|uniref:amino acid permease n=1 Tax=Bacillus sp. V2I10 TaxID=3042276 RepID=UPI00277EEDC9|nr:amino acid permease [Bacillus sp. V2I10]MDQ0860813.1 L-asparagine transporter-like permease [Bacillus sp. V2I10]